MNFIFNYKFILVVNKASLINMEALTEENNFGMALSERQSAQNQDQGNNINNNKVHYNIKF